MSEDRITEKVYCYDHPSAYHQNNDAAILTAAMCNRRDNDNPMAMAAMMNGGFGANQWMNNPFAYMMMMAMMRMFGWGNGCGDGYGNNCGGGNSLAISGMQDQISAIRETLSNNQNFNCIEGAIRGVDSDIRSLADRMNCDINTVNNALCAVRAQIAEVGGQVGFSAERVINAANLGDCRIIEALKECCCQTQRQIADFRADIQLQNCRDTAELRNGQRDLGVAISKGFSDTNYERQKQTCDIINAQNAGTQRIIDTLNSHWNDENQRKIQDLKFELSQERQNNLLLSRLSGNNCGCNSCGCNNGCNNF